MDSQFEGMMSQTNINQIQFQGQQHMGQKVKLRMSDTAYQTNYCKFNLHFEASKMLARTFCINRY